MRQNKGLELFWRFCHRLNCSSAQGLSGRKIAASLGLSRGAVGAYQVRATAVGLAWPLPEDLTDADLEGALFPQSAQVLSVAFPQPDWAHVHTELRRKGVTLSLLWAGSVAQIG